MFKYRQNRETPVTIRENNIFRTLFLATVVMTLIMIFLLSLLQRNDESVSMPNEEADFEDAKVVDRKERYASESPTEFVFDSESCKIPNLNPFSSEALSVFKAVKAENCSNLLPLTTLERSSDGVRIIINGHLKMYYTSWFFNEITCCYQRITRSGTGSNADNEFTLSACVEFQTGHLLSEDDDFLLVTCKKCNNVSAYCPFKTEVYKNAHAVVNGKRRTSQKSHASGEKTNLLFIGIDSISRLHLIRAMPATYEYLRAKQWLEMRAFNKINDNTFPNFMAILAGVNQSHAFEECSTKETGGIDKCRFLWNEFHDANYATAYAEDSMEITTFNFYKKGFLKQPTDHYFRPFALAAEKYLKTTHDKPWNTNCVGNQHYADYIYNYAADFADIYRNDSYFGVFWTNSFSHDDINLPSGYDVRMRNHLASLEERDLLENTIVIFFSDHGMRFGEIRKFFTGWLEERLPFLFIWIPEKFRARYPDLVKNLETNRDRLTTPYDIYLTAKHVLQLSSPESEHDLTAISCPACQSLLHEVPLNRSCADAAIPENYCTCSPYREIDHTQSVIANIASFVVTVLNAVVSAHKQCARMELLKVLSARELHYNEYKDYLVTLSVLPSHGEFEATVRRAENTSQFVLLGDVSRINRYGDQSRCVRDSQLRKYCYCT